MGNGAPSDNIILANQGTSGTFSVNVYDGGTVNHAATAGISTGTWYHIIVILKSNGDIVIYQNGSQAGTTSVDNNNNGFTNIARNNVYIGKSNWSPDGYF